MTPQFGRTTPSTTLLSVSASSVKLTNTASTPETRTITGFIDLFYEIVKGRTVFTHLQLQRISPSDFLFVVTEMSTSRILTASLVGVVGEIGGKSGISRHGKYVGSFKPYEARIHGHQFENTVLLRSA